DGENPRGVHLDNVRASHNGAPVTLRNYLDDWITAAFQAQTAGFDSYNLPEGDYEASITYSTELPPGELTLDGEDIESGTLEIAFTLQVIRPKIQSHIDVATRGRSISLA